MMRLRLSLTLAAVGVVLAGACGAAVATAQVREPATIPLAPVVAAWPTGFVVDGMKSEPLYTEHIRVERDSDDLRLRIEVVGQGDEPFGTQESAVHVGDDGIVTWTAGCPKDPTACADDTQLRGFLTTAAVIALVHTDRLPHDGVVRDVHGTPAVCIDDAALHPDAPPPIVRLDPCFDLATGAVLAHWSPDSAAFVGATLAPGFTVTARP